MLIERPPQWFRWFFPGALFRMPPSPDGQRRVYLTFDDGPIPEATPWVLDVLDDFGAKATFFMVGENIQRYPRLLEEVRKRGHGVGNHTLHHMKGVGNGVKNYMDDVVAAHNLCGSNLFRPPHGWISPSQFKALKKRCRVVMYDLVTRDYSKIMTPEDVVDNVKKYTRDGSIIVFHDSLKSLPRLRSAIPASLEWLTTQGYKFNLIPDYLPPKR